MFSDPIQSLPVNLGYCNLGCKHLSDPLREQMISFTCPAPLCYIFENMFISFYFSTAEMLFLLIREEIVLPEIQITYFLPRIQLTLFQLHFFWKMEVYLFSIYHTHDLKNDMQIPAHSLNFQRLNCVCH